MEAKTLNAHFDGSKIQLDEPFEFEANTKLLITVLPKSQDEEREEWARLAMETFARAYGPDEPDYSDAIKEVNPEYEGR